MNTNDSNESIENTVDGTDAQDGGQTIEQAFESAEAGMASGELTEDEAVEQITDAVDSGSVTFPEDELEATGAEAEALMASDTGGQAPEETGPEDKGSTGGDKEKAAPAYAAFITAVHKHLSAVGVSLDFKEQKGFFQFGSKATGHRLYVAKQGRGVTRVDTTLPRTALVVNGKDISLPLTKPNGRVACHVDPSVESVNAALEVLASYQDKISAPKKPATKAV
jgi:hypothetical protein